jgi:hypothetical protein
MATYQLKDPSGKVINTFSEADAASMKSMGLASGYTMVPVGTTSTGSTSPAIGPQKDTNPVNPASSNSAMSDAQKKAVVDRVASKTDDPTVAAKAASLQGNNYQLPSTTGKTEPTKTLQDAVEKNLPEAESKSSLVDFADALDKATTLARQGRQARELGILDDFGFKPGQVNASTMGQILGLLDARSGTRTETLHTAAVDAYKMEEERKATEKTNIQNLALQMLTKGVDQTTIQGILNTTSLDQAMLASAGALKATKDYQDIREIDGKLIGITKDGKTEVIYEGVGGTGTDFTDVQKLKLEAAGLANAPREQQLAALYPADETMTAEQKKVLYQQEFDMAKEYATTFDGTDEELEASLRRDSEHMTDSDIQAVIDTRPPSDGDMKQAAIEVVVGVWNPDLLQSRSGGEFKDAKDDAKKAIYKDPYNIQKGSDAEKRILAQIDALTYDDVKDVLDL